MKGKKTGGRTKGTPNKTTSIAKEAIEFAAEGLGGGQRLMAWAKADVVNERIFWSQIYTKLLPMQVTGAEGKDLIPQSITLVMRVNPDAKNRT